MAANQKKYSCYFCSKTFSRSEHQARHERSHTGIKPFECKVCRHAFVRRDLLQRHIRTVHRDTLLMKRKSQQDQEQQESIARQNGVVEAEGGTADGGARGRGSGSSFSSGSGSGSCSGSGSGPGSGPGSVCELGSTKNELYLELLVNSMIRVNNDATAPLLAIKQGTFKKQSFDLGDEQCMVLQNLFARYASTATMSYENIRNFYNTGMRNLERVDKFKLTLSEINNDRILAILCIGSMRNQQIRDDIWQISWSNINDIVALDIMQHGFALIDYKPADILQFFNKFQRVYLDSKINQLFYWQTFDSWVKLLRITNEPNNISSLILNNIVREKFIGKFTVEEFFKNSRGSLQKLLLSSVDILSNVIYCHWLFFCKLNALQIFQNKIDFHNALKMVNTHYVRISKERRQQREQKKFKVKLQYKTSVPESFKKTINQRSLPIQSDNHWLLLETFWFEFMDQINSSRQIWFMDAIAPIDISLINENLSICALPILTIVQQTVNHEDIKKRYLSLITDVVIFLIKIFEIELSVNNVKFHPNRIFKLLSNQSIQLLLVFEYLTIFQDSNIEMYAIDHFMNEFIFRQGKVIDNMWDVRSSFLDTQSLIFIGFYQLVQAIIKNLKDEIITKKLRKIQSLSHHLQSRLNELSIDSLNYQNEYYYDYDSQSSTNRSINDPWQSNNGLAIQSPGSINSLPNNSVSSGSEGFNLQNVGMTHSSSLDSSTFRNSNVILPPLNMNMNSIRRPSLDQSMMLRNQQDFSFQHHRQQYNNNIIPNNNSRNSLGNNGNNGSNSINHNNGQFYSYGAEPVSPKTIPQTTEVLSPTFVTHVNNDTNPISSLTASSYVAPANASTVSPNSSCNVSDPAFSDSGSPPTINNVRLPPPSHLFGVSSK